MANKNNKKNHYIDNEKFYKELKAWLREVKSAERAGEEKPRVTEYLGACIQKIAQNLSHVRSFRSYSFREDMVSDAIVNCLQYIENFDADRFNNPFAYFTQISYYAFLRRISKEHKQLATIYKTIERSEIFNQMAEMQSHDESAKTANMMAHYSEGARDKMNDFMERYEKKQQEKKNK